MDSPSVLLCRQGSPEPGANPTLVPELPQSVKRQEQQPTELRIKLCREGKQATLGVDVAFDEDWCSLLLGWVSGAWSGPEVKCEKVNWSTVEGNG